MFLRPGTALAAVAIMLPALVLLGCTDPRTSGTMTPPNPIEPWNTNVSGDHPLVGRIWDVARQRFVSPSDLAEAFASADFMLLGEKHDNPDHHRLQGWLIKEVVERGRRPAIAFEMLDSKQEDALATHLRLNPDDSAGIGDAVGWEKRGWPAWSEYEPIASAGLAAGAPLIAGAAERERLRGIAKNGLASSDADGIEGTRLAAEVPGSMRSAMAAEIVESHCGYLPETAANPLVDVQIAKDATMAAALQRGLGMERRNSTILIAGAGHVRSDFGVPWHLQRVAPAAKRATIAFLEVSEGSDNPADYRAAGDTAAPFDFIWFTPRVDNDDPCEAFAEQLQRMRERRAPDQP